MKNKKIILIILTIILFIVVASFVCLFFLRINILQNESSKDGYYCKIARQQLKDNEIINKVPCTEKSGSISNKTNSVLVTFHLYTPSDWSYKNYQMYEIDKKSEKIIDGIAPN